MRGDRHPLFGYLTAHSQPSADRPDLSLLVPGVRTRCATMVGGGASELTDR